MLGEHLLLFSLMIRRAESTPGRAGDGRTVPSWIQPVVEITREIPPHSPRITKEAVQNYERACKPTLRMWVVGLHGVS